MEFIRTVMIVESMREYGLDWKKYSEIILSKINSGIFDFEKNLANNCRYSKSEICSYSAATESAKQACLSAYIDETNTTIVNGQHLSRQYYQSRMTVVEQRLAQAGLRLAAILNDVLGDNDEEEQTGYISESI